MGLEIPNYYPPWIMKSRAIKTIRAKHLCQDRIQFIENLEQMLRPYQCRFDLVRKVKQRDYPTTGVVYFGARLDTSGLAGLDRPTRRPVHISIKSVPE